MNNGKQKLPLCEYAKDVSEGMRVIVKCTITNNLCPMIRWCPVNSCPKMNDKFKSEGCNIAIKKKIKDRKDGGD